MTKRAVLLFALEADIEAKRHRHWKVGDKLVKRLFSTLNHRAKQIAQNSEGDFFHFDSRQQKGNSYGERLSNAIASLINQQYEQIVIIGNDHVDLESKDIDEAFSILDQDKDSIFCLPAKDGGTALIAISKSSFNFDEFASLPWQTNQLYESICKKWKNPSYDKVYQDVDDLKAISRLIKSSGIFWIHSFQLLSLLCQILFFGRYHNPTFKYRKYKVLRISNDPLRAPPLI